MTAQLSPIPVQKFFDNNGFPLFRGTLTTYQAGTTTPQATYIDSTQTTQNTNPITLNYRGECNLWLDPTLTYKFVLKDFFGNLIWTVDNIQGGFTPSAIAASLIPKPTNTWTLGDSTHSWAQLYLGGNASPALDIVSGIIGYYPRTPAEIAAGVTPTNYAYAPGNLLRYGADPTGVADSTAAINRWVSVSGATGVSLYAPAGTYLTSGGHTINAKQDIYGDGIQRTIFNHTSNSTILFSLPLYGVNQASVEFGGNRFRDFSCVGQGPTNTNEVAWYVKNKTDVKWDHIEVTGFGYGFKGARDDPANSCTDLTFIACRVLNCGYGLWAPLQWNACSILGGCFEGTIYSIVTYDSSNWFINTNVQLSTGAFAGLFAAGCQGCSFQLYCEGNTAQISFLPANTKTFVFLGQVDITNVSNPNGIALQANKANRVHGGVFGSGSGVNYCCVQSGGNGCTYETLNAGSGIGSGVVYLTTGTTGNFIGVNWANSGINATYQTPTDQASNFELSASSGVSHLGVIDTASIYLDEGSTSDTSEVAINKVGYQGGTTHFRRCTIYDGKGNVLLQVDGSTATINLAASTILAANLPTINPGGGSNKLWVNGGVVTRA